MNKLLLLCFVIGFQIALSQNCLDVKYKLRGYFYAGTSVEDSTAFGGFAQSDNLPKKITPEIAQLAESDQFQIIVNPEHSLDYMEGISGFKVYIVNQSDSLVKLPAKDSRISVVRQVFYKNEWKDIEYLPSSWCGNSYHYVYARPNEFWEFTVPCLSGKIKAKFRFEVYVNPNLILYSNEFTGSFNKNQLTEEQGHKPLGIMDSYDN